jgi:hypothetical protein
VDDLLELAIRLLDPIVTYLGPHAVAFVAIAGALVTYANSRKQRRREKRLESKVDFLITIGGHIWNAESAASNAYTVRTTSLSSWMGKYLVPCVMWFIRQAETVKYKLLRRVMGMQISKTWIVVLLGYIALLIKQLGGYEVPVVALETVADILIYVTPLVLAYLNRKKGVTTFAKYKDDEYVG